MNLESDHNDRAESYLSPLMSTESDTSVSVAKAEQIARDVFGFGALRESQKKVLEVFLTGRDTLAVLPTGSGKSLCYALPALMGDGIAVVISPLIALIRDQVVKMRKFGIAAAAVDSLQTPEQKKQVFDALLQKRVKVLFVSPERFSLPSFRAMLGEQSMRLIAIDEAHCISQWGYHFRPEYRRIGEYLSDFPGVPKIALTATAKRNVREDIVAVLKMKDPSIQVNSPARDNIAIDVEQFSTVNEQTESIIEDILAAPGQGIVYVSTRKAAQKLVQSLKQSGESAFAYHGGLDSRERERVLQRFLDSSSRIVVATNAFGLGVDKSDIRFIFHYGVPQSFEQYIQEIGRGGRDGKPSFSKLYFTSRDLHIQKFILEKSFVEHTLLQHCAKMLTEIFSENNSWSSQELAQKLSIKAQAKTEETEVCIDAFYRAGWISKWTERDAKFGYITVYRLEKIPDDISDFVESYQERRELCFEKLDAMKTFVSSGSRWHEQIDVYFNE